MRASRAYIATCTLILGLSKGEAGDAGLHAAR